MYTQAMNRENIVVATRIHRNNAQKDQQVPDATKDALKHFYNGWKKLNVDVLVACDAADEALKQTVQEIVKQGLVPVQEWQKFIPALNALVSTASRMGKRGILFCSLEMEPDFGSLETLMGQMSSDTLVVGKALAGHDFEPGMRELKGTTTPWNTFALWNLSQLALTGFLLVSEGISPGVEAGVEEVAVIALHSHLYQTKSKLIATSSGEWKQEWQDSERQAWHQQKMASKNSRPAKHLELLKIPAGQVEHTLT